MKQTDFIVFWLPIIGGVLLGGFAGTAWYGGNKILGLWLGFAGIVCFLLVGTIQIQQAISRTGPDGPSKVRVRAMTMLTPSGGSLWNPVDVLYAIVNEGRSTAHITRRNFAVHLSEPGQAPKGAPAFDFETEDRSRVDVAAGSGINGQYISKLRLTWEQQEMVRNGQLVILFNGYVTYVDDAGISTTIFFLQRWDHATERFFTVEDPDYERPDPH
ncbi:MAG: hypothetical protein WAL39_02665 [Xanthobacteraceae bacterium]